ncbi:MAG: 2-oxoacid:acceptor oxidoreductase subunit alpha [Candidatus Kapaibacterium sp.]|jgi:2-oxoglutarate ferredoxin oxidoreductase subunit alpha|nr:2-oxoacid:acceptor oxidoreductase subunit alpha [Candidatus Kapabacteria bacterium]
MDKQFIELESATIRFAGDSGDGMQLTGTQFSDTSAGFGNEVNTFPDYPSEIRAPEGTLYGVSAYQVHFGSKETNTPGDEIDVLVAMNASSLKVNLKHVRKHGLIIANKAGFKDKNLKLAKCETNPLDDGSLKDYQVFAYDINESVRQILEDSGLPSKVIDRTKNLYALGLAYWLFDRPLEPTESWLKKKFGKKPEVLEANLKVLKAGYEFAAINQDMMVRYNIKPAKLEKGTYRNITGNEAVALGLVTAANRAGLPLFLGSYPITPATEILHHLSGYKQYRVKHMQMEDEIGGITSAIGAAYGGALATTSTSGPGLSLKVEAMGLAVMLEIPLVIVDVQRAGPSTGLPTKPEQSDLYMAMWGRHGEAPMPVLCAVSSTDCFDMTIEAARIALKYMTPVILLTDGYLAQGTEAWKIPDVNNIPPIEVNFASDPETYQPYKRDPETLARMWAIPGTPGLEHRIGGLEKENGSGLVSHDAMNHQRMCEIRAEKVARIANDIPLAEIDGPESGEILVISWGSTHGAIKNALASLRAKGRQVSHVSLRYINPLPRNIGEIMEKFDTILLPEMNLGQLKTMLQAKFLKPIIGYNKIQGSTFTAKEIEIKIEELLSAREN